MVRNRYEICKREFSSTSGLTQHAMPFIKKEQHLLKKLHLDIGKLVAHILRQDYQNTIKSCGIFRLQLHQLQIQIHLL